MTREYITEKRKTIHLLQHYLYGGNTLYIIGCIHDYDADPVNWTISLMRLPDRKVSLRDFTVFIDLLDKGLLKFTEVKPA
jgi:hypothetical protein